MRKTLLETRPESMVKTDSGQCDGCLKRKGRCLVLRTSDMQTLPVVIYLLQGERRTPYGMLMAGGLLTTLPLVLAFLLFQRHFVRGITSGALKT